MKTVQKNELVKSINQAINNLDPIKFVLNGDEYEYKPIFANTGLARNYFKFKIPDEVTAKNSLHLKLYREALPTIRVGSIININKPTYENSVDVNLSSPEDINKAIKYLWKKEEERFWSTSFMVERYAWCQGNNYEKDLSTEFPTKIHCSWEDLCKFSVQFTNGLKENYNPSLVYMDNSAHFKVRGVFTDKYTITGINKKQITLTRIIKSAESSIKHPFGEWEGFEKNKTATYYFKSCNGNVAIAKYEPETKMFLVQFSTEECSYFEYLKYSKFQK